MDQNNQDSGIEFEGDQWQAPTQLGEGETSKMTQWVTKYSGGLIKNSQQANYALVIFCLIGMTISLVLFFKL